MARFDDSIELLWANEGGFDNDTLGGPTRYGISSNAYPHLRERIITGGLSRAEAREIYRRDYWNKLGLDSVRDPSLANAIFDFGVNSGPGRVSRAMRELLGVEGRGVLTQAEITEINRRDPATLTRGLTQWRADYLQRASVTNEKLRKKLPGLLARTRRVGEVKIMNMNGNQGATPPPASGGGGGLFGNVSTGNPDVDRIYQEALGRYRADMAQDVLPAIQPPEMEQNPYLNPAVMLGAALQGQSMQAVAAAQQVRQQNKTRLQQYQLAQLEAENYRQLRRKDWAAGLAQLQRSYAGAVQEGQKENRSLLNEWRQTNPEIAQEYSGMMATLGGGDITYTDPATGEQVTKPLDELMVADPKFAKDLMRRLYGRLTGLMASSMGPELAQQQLGIVDKLFDSFLKDDEPQDTAPPAGSAGLGGGGGGGGELSPEQKQARLNELQQFRDLPNNLDTNFDTAGGGIGELNDMAQMYKDVMDIESRNMLLEKTLQMDESGAWGAVRGLFGAGPRPEIERTAREQMPTQGELVERRLRQKLTPPTPDNPNPKYDRKYLLTEPGKRDLLTAIRERAEIVLRQRMTVGADTSRETVGDIVREMVQSDFNIGFAEYLRGPGFRKAIGAAYGRIGQEEARGEFLGRGRQAQTYWE